MNKLFSAALKEQLENKNTVSNLKKVPLDEIKITEAFYPIYDEVLMPKIKLPNQLFISDFSGAENKEAVECDKIKTIISVTMQQPRPLRGVTYHSFKINDESSEDIASILPKTCSLIDDALKTGSVLVHCNMGVSRSGSIIVAYIMSKTKASFEESLKMAKDCRSMISPNIGFRKQLKDFELFLNLGEIKESG